MSNLTDFFPSSSSGASGGNNALLVMVGGGGGASSTQGLGVGAQGGNILCTFLTLQTGVTCPIVVGAGGATGTGPAGLTAAVGGDGGYSSFGELRAPGGGGAYSILFTPPSTVSIALGGIGAAGCTVGFQSQQMLRALPLSYPGYVGNVARQRLDVCPACIIAEVGRAAWSNTLGVDYGTILYKTQPITNCPSGSFPVACAIPTCPPACTTPVATACRVVCSGFYNVELTGQPYSGSYFITCVPGPCAPTGITCQFNIACNSIGCSRYGGGCYVSCGPPGYFNNFCQCMVIPNNPNTGHGGRCAGCNGDSGVVVLFYPTAIPAATSFPGGTDCTPVSCPFGMRAYKFTTSGSITI